VRPKPFRGLTKPRQMEQTQAEQRLVSKRTRLDNGLDRDYLPVGSKYKQN